MRFLEEMLLHSFKDQRKRNLEAQTTSWVRLIGPFHPGNLTDAPVRKATNNNDSNSPFSTLPRRESIRWETAVSLDFHNMNLYLHALGARLHNTSNLFSLQLPSTCGKPCFRSLCKSSAAQDDRVGKEVFLLPASPHAIFLS